MSANPESTSNHIKITVQFRGISPIAHRAVASSILAHTSTDYGSAVRWFLQCFACLAGLGSLGDF